MQETIDHRTGEAAAPGLTREPFVFSGTAREYFGIWLVNIVLTILTLGVYSAWAKVRRLRYFHGNTTLAGASFDYHARPVQILIGRVIVLVLLVLYNLALQFVPLFGGILFVVFLLALPWFIMRGMRFSARVTSYRNVRFDFHGGYGGAFLAFVLGWGLTWATLGLLAPLASQWSWRYTLDNLTYGGRPVSCDPRLERMFAQWWLPFFVLVGGVVFFALGGLALFMGLAGFVGDAFGRDASAAVGAMLMLVYVAALPVILLYGIAALLYRAGTRNVALNETVIDGRHLMASSLGRWRYTWIAVSNLVVTVLSLGLMRPWAAIRMARYVAASTALYTTGRLDDYLGEVRDSGPAVGAEYMDVEGLDFGF